MTLANGLLNMTFKLQIQKQTKKETGHIRNSPGGPNTEVTYCIHDRFFTVAQSEALKCVYSQIISLQFWAK